MRRRFISVPPEETVFDAGQIMRFCRIRHLPVLREGVLVGMLSHRDVLAAGMSPQQVSSARRREEFLRSIPVERVMTSSVECAPPDMTLAKAANRLYVLRIGCLPVVEPSQNGPRVLGLLTETDLLRAAYDPVGDWL